MEGLGSKDVGSICKIVTETEDKRSKQGREERQEGKELINSKKGQRTPAAEYSKLKGHLKVVKTLILNP